MLVYTIQSTHNYSVDPWNNGKEVPRWGVVDIQIMSPSTTVGDAADMQLPCYQTRESPSSGKCSIFCYRLTYISKMYSMHTKQIVSNPPEKVIGVRPMYVAV